MGVIRKKDRSGCYILKTIWQIQSTYYHTEIDQSQAFHAQRHLSGTTLQSRNPKNQLFQGAFHFCPSAPWPGGASAGWRAELNLNWLFFLLLLLLQLFNFFAATPLCNDSSPNQNEIISSDCVFMFFFFFSNIQWSKVLIVKEEKALEYLLPQRLWKKWRWIIPTWHLQLLPLTAAHRADKRRY